MYINDLPDQLIKKTFYYADDTKIIGQISERDVLQFDINRAIEWSGSKKLNFNFANSAFSSGHTAEVICRRHFHQKQKTN